MDQTLEELRAENAAAEAAANPDPQSGATEVEDDAAEGTDTDDDLAEGGEGEEGQQAEPEEWMKGDSQESQGAESAEKKFTDFDIKAAKTKYKAKLEKQHQSELDQMRQQLEELRSKQVTPEVTAKPKREDFYDHDDPDEAYFDALTDWKVKANKAQEQAGNQEYEQKRRQLEAHQKITQSVDQHYERAASLAAASGISPDLYQSADKRVREAIQGVYGGESGEYVTNKLISRLGEGSEKVMYKLGVSPKCLAELTAKLQEDPEGLQALFYLGRLSAELTAPARKKSNTPSPATNVQGDANTADIGRGLHRRYLEAHKRGDTQAAYDVREEAKEKKINVKSW